MANVTCYNDLRRFLLHEYGCRVGKLCLDGGFTCPNRDGTVGRGGCSFCGSEGAGEYAAHGRIPEEIAAELARHRKDRHGPPEKYIAYFQSFSGTYAPPEVLREAYTAAVAHPDVVCLAVGTRPDCVDATVADLLASFRPRCDVWVELGLQTANDKTAAAFNRGYPSSVFTKAVRLLTDRGIKVIAHMIVGLPGEDHGDVARTVAFLNRHPLFGVKIHSLYVMKGTRLGEAYLRGEYTPLTLEDYTAEVVWILRHLRPDVTVHRITGDAPRRLLLAPSWATDKKRVISIIENALARAGCQGDCLEEDHGTGTPL